MPYLDEKRKRKLTSGERWPREPGELNFCITHLCTEYLKEFEKVDYRLYNEVMGVLECAKQEFYRRAVVQLEELKRAVNGDVYEGVGS